MLLPIWGPTRRALACPRVAPPPAMCGAGAGAGLLTIVSPYQVTPAAYNRTLRHVSPVEAGQPEQEDPRLTVVQLRVNI